MFKESGPTLFVIRVGLGYSMNCLGVTSNDPVSQPYSGIYELVISMVYI
jgi:hypothetical protein